MNIYNEDDLDTVICSQNNRMLSQILSTRYTHFGYFFVTQDAAGSKFLRIHFHGMDQNFMVSVAYSLLQDHLWSVTYSCHA